MSLSQRVLITGAAGNLGDKLRRHLTDRCELRLLDRESRGDAAIREADLSRWSLDWVDLFHDVDAVVHLAADPVAYHDWNKLLAPNVDALINVFLAAVRGGVRRVVYASSNHVMGGYQEQLDVTSITPDLPPRPGTHYIADGQPRDSTPYATAKLFGERLGQGFAEAHDLSVIAARLGWVLRGENRPQDLPVERGSWFRQMWLSNRDYCHLMECCLTADPALKFAVVNGMSRNTGSRWDLESTRRMIAYEPQDDVEASRLLAPALRGES